MLDDKYRHQYDDYMYHYEQQTRNNAWRKDDNTPHQLFELAIKSPIIKTYLDGWRYGHCKWEEALIGIIRSLQQQNDKLIENVITQALQSPMIIPIEELTKPITKNDKP